MLPAWCAADLRSRSKTPASWHGAWVQRHRDWWKHWHRWGEFYLVNWVLISWYIFLLMFYWYSIVFLYDYFVDPPVFRLKSVACFWENHVTVDSWQETKSEIRCGGSRFRRTCCLGKLWLAICFVDIKNGIFPNISIIHNFLRIVVCNMQMGMNQWTWVDKRGEQQTGMGAKAFWFAKHQRTTACVRKV